MDQQEKFASRLKICGLTRCEDLVACGRKGVAYVGFNFYRGSKRFIRPDEAAQIWRQAKSLTHMGCRVAAVFVDAEINEVRAALAAFPEVAIVQCHGREGADYRDLLRPSLQGRELWQAVRVAAPADVNHEAADLAGVDLVLFDAASALDFGGTGRSFDWRALSLLRSSRYAVAGGVNELNVGQLLALPNAPAVIDVCSGAEVSPGVKDARKIRSLQRFFAPAKAF